MLHEMGLVRLYSTPKTSSGANDASQTSSSRCHIAEKSSFCRCQQDKKCIVRKVYLDPARNEKYRHQMSLTDTCRCGEDTCRIINWTWDTQNLQPQVIITNNMVQFHPYYSQGMCVPTLLYGTMPKFSSLFFLI